MNHISIISICFAFCLHSPVSVHCLQHCPGAPPAARVLLLTRPRGAHFAEAVTSPQPWLRRVDKAPHFNFGHPSEVGGREGGREVVTGNTGMEASETRER